MKSRFELFTALSLAAHVGVFVGVRAVERRHRPESTEQAAGGTVGAGSSAAVGGETFEVPEREPPSEESAPGSEAAPIELDGQEAEDPTATAEGSTKKSSKAHRHPSSRIGGPPAASEPTPALYGAVGDRTAGDLVTTFKRVFPIAVSSDPLWEGVPVGFYAEGNVTFTLADDGTLGRTTASASAAPAFRAAVARTGTLLKHRLFTARGATTHLHMVVRVTDKVVYHGAFAIDSSGSFELPSGRRVTVSIDER